MSGFGGKPDDICSLRDLPVLTQSRHRRHITRLASRTRGPRKAFQISLALAPLSCHNTAFLLDVDSNRAQA
jgi:hypothetical protein